MILGLVWFFGGQIVVLLTMKKLKARFSWLLAIIMSAVFLLLIIRIQSPLQYYFASVLAGTAVYFYFVFYNIAYFENTSKEKIGRNSALMFSIPTVISLIGPLTAGFLAQISINFIWIFSLIFLIAPLILLTRQKDFVIDYKVKQVISEIKQTRLLIFLEGLWEAIIFGVIPIFSLFFIKTPLEYGAYLAYLSLISIVANTLLGHLTDKLQKRMVFLYPVTIILAITTFFFIPAVFNLAIWLIVTAIIQFILPIFWNLTTAMVVDAHPNLRLAIPGRELMLAAGRFLGIILVYLSLIFEKTPQLIFIILGGVMLFFTLSLWWKREVKKDYKFL